MPKVKKNNIDTKIVEETSSKTNKFNDELSNESNNNENKDNKENTKINKEYYNYVKEPLEKIIGMIDSQINYFNIEDIITTLNLINSLKINIHESILMLIEFDKILTNRFEILHDRKDTLVGLNQLFIEHNKLNILKQIAENTKNINKQSNSDIDLSDNELDLESIDKPKSLKKQSLKATKKTSKTLKNLKVLESVNLKEKTNEEINNNIDATIKITSKKQSSEKKNKAAKQEVKQEVKQEA